jgi:serine/threonine protein kinase
LELHVAGELTDGAGQFVTKHIETCGTCQQELHEIEANESFLTKIRDVRGSLHEGPSSNAWSDPTSASSSRFDLVELVRDGAGALMKAGAAGPASPNDETNVPSIPNYDLLYICGQGAFGKVWIVKDRAGVYRAMKIIEFDRAASAGIPHREMKALEHYCRSVPTHPNLVQIFHVGDDANRIYYTMELADNLWTRKPVREEVPPEYQPMTLQAVTNFRRLGVDTAIEIIFRLLKGLRQLHESGLVHRDIKPGNIIFVGRQVKLADVSLVTAKATQLSAVGTPSYMPPDERMDATADTYAIGKVAYEMLTHKDLSNFPRLPQNQEFKSSIWDPNRLDAFLTRACSNNAQERFDTAEAMMNALRGCRNRPYDSLLVDLVEYEDASGQTNASQDIRWKALDSLVRIMPWLVVLILGIYAIRQLA